jgi:type I restriction enzyme M protein
LGKKRQGRGKDYQDGLLPMIADDEELEEGAAEELVPEGKLVCALTGEYKAASPQEETLQSLIEQLHREYGIALEDIRRDVRLPCYYEDPRTGRVKSRNRTISLAVYESTRSREPKNIIRVAIVAKLGTKPDRKAIEGLEEVLGNLSQDRQEVFGVWTNGAEMAFRMRTFEARTGQPIYTELTDFPAPHEALADLESGTRRPLRIAAGDSLLRTFKRCHDYIHGWK